MGTPWGSRPCSASPRLVEASRKVSAVGAKSHQARELSTEAVTTRLPSQRTYETGRW